MKNPTFRLFQVPRHRKELRGTLGAPGPAPHSTRWRPNAPRCSTSPNSRVPVNFCAPQTLFWSCTNGRGPAPAPRSATGQRRAAPPLPNPPLRVRRRGRPGAARRLAQRQHGLISPLALPGARRARGRRSGAEGERLQLRRHLLLRRHLARRRHLAPPAARPPPPLPAWSPPPPRPGWASPRRSSARARGAGGRGRHLGRSGGGLG